MKYVYIYIYLHISRYSKHSVKIILYLYIYLSSKKLNQLRHCVTVGVDVKYKTEKNVFNFALQSYFANLMIWKLSAGHI